MKGSTDLQLEGRGSEKVSGILDIPELFPSNGLGVGRRNATAWSRSSFAVVEARLPVAVLSRARR